MNERDLLNWAESHSIKAQNYFDALEAYRDAPSFDIGEAVEDHEFRLYAATCLYEAKIDYMGETEND